ncbi:hypothetical protein PILCRDRAFT_819600 [Piloderma croceum F 1598]|uniref:Hyaluronan-mediated motility receptor C-terminal domain-containing protein n=1 Tax=Piloderma croceum (strain F 1598) TaxID=765440 RepID=A0A0C3FYN2_PILCF|nr:hypothetical protein PILCRDRAFT_819600 [Piloderma croceum F 1598]
MLFPKGPRFESLKVPDVPGPGAYNADQEYNWDAYKRGAFLEKADRFNKDRLSDGPGPGTYDTDAKLQPKPITANELKQSAAERYAVLQRKLDDLERIHADGKKSHQAEVDRLKFELTRSRQTTTDQADRLEKLKKLNDTLDVRLQEMRKSASVDQAELKDLRIKLRMAEHERTQLSSKQGEVGETKKALQAVESKRRDEMRERDRKIAELEKALAGEKKKREGADARLKEVKANADEEVQKVRQATQGLQGQVDEARNEVRRAQSSLANLEDKAENKEEELLTQLEQHRFVLGRVAEEYARLASVTVPVAEHSRLKHEHTVLSLHTLRIERKLANSEAQAAELANLIRHTKEQNGFLSAQLKDAQDAIIFYSQALKDATVNDAAPHATVDRTLDKKAAAIDQELRNSERRTQELRRSNIETSLEFYRHICEQQLLTYSATDKALVAEQQALQRQTAELSGAVTTRDTLATQLKAITTEHESAKQLLATANTALAQARADNEATEQQMVIVEERMRAEGAKNREALQKEREAAQRLTAAAQMSKMSEDGLRAELEQLTAELTDAERYQAAYYSLVDEVGALVDRNDLAEDEAERLSKFNAEILGHNNPAQRIMYVDRIRRELAETKHKLLQSTRDRETVATNNMELRNELDMYKSVMVPGENKPRTNITRIERPPLANQNLNVIQTAGPNPTKSVKGSGEKITQIPTLAPIPGDMTLDEIL